MADAEQMSLLEIFQQARLNVPRYQRSYAWNEKQVEDLIDDIEYVLDRRRSVGQSRNIVHYFGTIVLDDVKEVSSPTPNDWILYDIVDGQQRLTTISLFVSSICEELSSLEGYVDIDKSKEQGPNELYETYRNMYVKYKKKENGRRLTPAELTQSAYSNLVISEKEPETILSNSSNILPARRLAESKQIIQDWLSDKQNEHFDGDLDKADQDDIRNHFDFLYDTLSIIDNTFEVTRYEVDDTAEAGRLFEVVNDRGKALTVAEKIKSHLLYCAGEIDLLDPEEVARDFNQAVETITISGGNEELVDQFVKRHWEMFAGETKRSRPQTDINGLHRRIKQINRYASLERDPQNLADWVNEYVRSLLDSAEAFYAVYDASHLEDQYSSIDDDTLKKIRAIDNCGASSTFRPLLMAAYLELDVTGDRFAQIVDTCETFSFRAFEVMNRSTTLLRRTLKQEAHRLYVADENQIDLENLFGEVPLDDLYSDTDDAVEKVCDLIDSETGKRAPDEDVIDHLTRKDVLNGEFTTGWGGFHNKTTIKYLLYEYERFLREKQGDTGLESLVGFDKFDEDSQIEHIAPRNPSDDRAELDNHRENRHRLGNLAFLWPEDNQKGGNERYKNKYENVYDGSRIAILEELPSPSKGWNLETIDARQDALVEFATDRWSGRKQAQVIVSSIPEREIKQELRERVQSHYSHTNGGKLTTIKFVGQDGADISGGHSGAMGRSCPTCSGVISEVSLDGDIQCACGRDLDIPNYQII